MDDHMIASERKKIKAKITDEQQKRMKTDVFIDVRRYHYQYDKPFTVTCCLLMYYVLGEGFRRFAHQSSSGQNDHRTVP